MTWVWSHLPELGLVWVAASVPVALVLSGGGGKEAPTVRHDSFCPECREVA